MLREAMNRDDCGLAAILIWSCFRCAWNSWGNCALLAMTEVPLQLHMRELA